jgi:hypothetical protein
MQYLRFAALKDPTRPKSILFRLAAENDIEHIDNLLQKRNSQDKSAKKGSSQSNHADDNEGDLVKTINIDDEYIGIKFASSPDGYGLVVSEFLKGSEDKYPGIESNYLLSHVNGKNVLGDNGSGKEEALRLLEIDGASRPLSLGFVRPYLYNVVIEKGAAFFGGPSELVLSEVKPAEHSSSKENKIVLKGFSQTEGAAESGKVFVGDNLIFINGIPVGAGCRLTDGRKAKCPSLGKWTAMTCFAIFS